MNKCFHLVVLFLLWYSFPFIHCLSCGTVMNMTFPETLGERGFCPKAFPDVIDEC